MKIADLSVGDKLEDYRTGAMITITAIEPWSGGNGEISFDQSIIGRRRRMLTFRQFERLKFIRRPEDRRS